MASSDPTTAATQLEPSAELPADSSVQSAASFRSSHDEKHNENNEVVRDIIIGFADGLTVPFALTAGLSS